MSNQILGRNSAQPSRGCFKLVLIAVDILSSEDVTFRAVFVVSDIIRFKKGAMSSQNQGFCKIPNFDKPSLISHLTKIKTNFRFLFYSWWNNCRCITKDSVICNVALLVCQMLKILDLLIFWQQKNICRIRL